LIFSRSWYIVVHYSNEKFPSSYITLFLPQNIAMEIVIAVSERFYYYFILESTSTLLAWLLLIFVCVFPSGKKPIPVEIRSKFAQGLKLKT